MSDPPLPARGGVRGGGRQALDHHPRHHLQRRPLRPLPRPARTFRWAAWRTTDALALAAAVLDDHGIDRADIQRQALVDLMDHLGGHPLSLYLVLPHLREHTPGRADRAL